MKQFVTNLYILNLVLSIFLTSFVYGQRFAVISDFRGATPNTLYVSEIVKSWNPDFIITAGDNFCLSEGTIDEQVGQFYHEYIYPYTGSYGQGDTINRFFPALGNHDISGTGLSDYISYFELLNNERYYDFIWGDIHFFAINSNTNEADGTSDTSIQALWLKNKLAESESSYKIVYFHHPPYSSGTHGSTQYMQWPFKQWGATAIISGHEHYYERLFIDSLTYFINGSGGTSLYSAYNAISGSQFHYSDNYGAMLVEAYNDSICFSFININDSLIDRKCLLNEQTGYKKLKNNLIPIFLSYPNPAYKGTSTIIKFYLPLTDMVCLKVCNIFGNVVEVLFDEKKAGGIHEIEWDTKKLRNGFYYLCLQTSMATATMKIVLIK
ncbi:MAG: metallophosphoesterase [Bacteroidia bacterium]|nr:metallophosphoesterase [Bacteroidia bacterium]